MRSRRIRIRKESLSGPLPRLHRVLREPAAEVLWEGPTRLQRPGLWASTGFNKGALQVLLQGRKDRKSVKVMGFMRRQAELMSHAQ